MMAYVLGGMGVWFLLAAAALALVRAGKRLDEEYQRGVATGRRSERADEAREPLLASGESGGVAAEIDFGAVFLPRQPRVVCAWCDLQLSPGCEPVTHGICAGCKEALLTARGGAL